jgi:outer membrane protein TolC
MLLGIILSGVGAHSQVKTLTIEDLFRQVEYANTEVRLAHRDVTITLVQSQSEKDGRLPDIGISLDGNYIGNVYVLDRDFSNATRSPMTHWGNSFGISVYQPLYTGGEITAKIRKTESQAVIAKNNVALVEDDMKMLILQEFLELFKNRNLLNVYDENIHLTTELVDEMRARVSQGIALGNDVTRYDLTLSNLKYDRLTVANAIQNLNYSLVSYLQLNETDTIIPTIDFNRINFSAAPSSEWMALSHRESPQLKQYELQKSVAIANEKLIKSECLPKIGFNAGTSVVAPITTHTPVLDKNLSRWYVGLSVAFTPSSFYKSAHRLQAARLTTARLQEARQAHEEAIDRKIDKAYKCYTEAVEHVTIQKQNVDLASENYRIVERRYNNDLSLLTDMLDASTAKIDAEMRLVNAQVDVLYYYFQLKYLSGII